MKWMAIGWMGTGLLLGLFDRVLYEQLWIASVVPIATWGLTGLLILFAAAIAARDPTRRRPAIHTALVVLLGAILFLPAAGLGTTLTGKIRFYVRRPQYDRIVAAVRGAQESLPRASGRQEGISYEVDPGPPIRVAFPWPGGIIDNWCGIVYDPTGEVLAVNEFKRDASSWNEPRLAAVKGLFGGDMFSCLPVEGAYYECCFT